MSSQCHVEKAKRRILVTGAVGYVGRLTVAELVRRKSDCECVVAFDVREVAATERLPGVVYLTGDIRNADMAPILGGHRIDTVIHLAFMLRLHGLGGRQFAYEVDVQGTRNVLEGCTTTRVDKLIVISSGAAYGYHADNPDWISEEDPLRGNVELAYSHHKRLVEDLLFEHAESHPELAQLIFRAGTILGENATGPIADFFEKRMILGIWGSDAPFNFVWDQDVVACLVQGAFEDRVGVFNLAGDGVLGTREIAIRLGKPYVPFPAWLLAAALWTLRRCRLSQYGPEQVRFLRYRPVLSNRRLKKVFGYVPRKSSDEVFELYARTRHA